MQKPFFRQEEPHFIAADQAKKRQSAQRSEDVWQRQQWI
jgi:hypothetical protein